MHHSRRSQMRSPFKHANSSSSSLEGMERPVRSFKAFIKTVPPNPPTYNKPLPSAPSPAVTPLSPPSSISTPSSPERDASVASWKTPAEWSNSNPYKREFLQTPTIASGRIYSPLLPEPSSDLSDKTIELRAAQMAFVSPQQRLMPIYERPSLPDLSPLRNPPISPLPSPPASSPYDEKQLPPLPRRSPFRNSAEINPGYTNLQTEFMYSKDSPAASATSNISNTSTKEEAFASLGTDSPGGKRPKSETKSYESPSSLSPDSIRRDRSYFRGKKLPALDKESSLDEDSCEDADMDDKTRQLSLSHDYHDLLAEQCQEMSVRLVKNETPANGKADRSRKIHASRLSPRDQDLVPPPLSWNTSSTNSSPRSSTREMEEMEEPVRHNKLSPIKEKTRSRTIASWAPHRLSVEPKRPVSNRRNPQYPSDLKQTRILESEVDNPIKKDLKFSRFFLPSKTKNAKKLKKTNGTATAKAPPNSVSPIHSPAPSIQLSGGLAAIRTTSSRSNALALSSPTKTAFERRHSTYQASSFYNASNHPTSSPVSTSYPSDNNLSSYIGRNSQPTMPAGPTITISKLRSLFASPHSSTSPSHPLLQEMIRPPPPPTSFHDPFTHTRTQSGNSTQRRSSDTGSVWQRIRGADEEEQKPGFFEKAREKRRVRARDARQERLKQSIRVLGPTDLGCVDQPNVKKGSYNEEWMSVWKGGRKPGYLVGG